MRTLRSLFPTPAALMRFALLVAALFCLISMYLLAVAHAAGDSSVVEETSDQLLAVLAPLVGGTFVWLAKNAAAWLKSKTGINFDAKARSIAEQAFRYVEEMAHRRLKETGVSMGWKEKEAKGLEWLRANMKRLGLPHTWEQTVIDYLLAEVNRHRDAGVKALEQRLAELSKRIKLSTLGHVDP
jgi:hypothetical protein